MIKERSDTCIVFPLNWEFHCAFYKRSQLISLTPTKHVQNSMIGCQILFKSDAFKTQRSGV